METLPHQPLIISLAVCYIVHVDCLGFDLIQDEISFCHQHPVILIGWDELCLQERITLWHLVKGTYGIHQLIFHLACDRGVF